MSIITRKDLVKKYKVAKNKVKELSEKKYEYKTQRDCQPFGKVAYMGFEEIAKAGASVHDGFTNIEASIARYGITSEDLPVNEQKYLGYTIEDWDHDFSLRVEELHDETTIEKYNKVIKKFEANFTDEDRFLIDMDEVNELDVDLSDDEMTAA